MNVGIISAVTKQYLSAEVELNKLILVRPTPLVYYDGLYIDQRDYDEIVSASQTAWHRLLRDNLKFLVSEGIARPVSFEKLLSVDDRLQISKVGESLTSDLTPEQVKPALLHAWRHYARYLDLKAHLASRGASEAALIPMFADRRKAWTQFAKLLTTDDDERFVPIYRHCLWKAEASRRIAERQSAVLHMAEEYEPFALLLQDAASRRTLAQKADDLIQHLFDLALPLMGIGDKQEQLAFLALRKNTLPIYRELCDRLEEIILRFQNEGLTVEDAKEYLTARWNDGIASLRSRLGFTKGLLVAAEVLLNTYVKSHVPIAPTIPKEVRTAVETLAERPLSVAAEYSPYRWQALFCSLFNETEFTRVHKHIAQLDASGGSLAATVRSDMWLDNPDRKPWYVGSLDTLKGQF